MTRSFCRITARAALVVLSLLWSSASFAGPTLYATDGPTLYELDPATGAVVRTIGQTGRPLIQAMDVDPRTGLLFATHQIPLSGSQVLTLNPQTGLATTYSPLILGRFFDDIAFDPHGRLYAVESYRRNHRANSPGLYQINLYTGGVRKILSFPRTSGPWAVSFDSGGRGILKLDNSLYVLSADLTSYTALSTSPSSRLYPALEFGDNDILYGFTDGSYARLYEIDPSTGARTLLGSLLPRYRSLASKGAVCFAVDAIDDTFSVINDGTPADLDVLRNETCASDYPLTALLTGSDAVPDQGGSIYSNGATLSYTPRAGYVGVEQFDYTAQDAGRRGVPAGIDQDSAQVTVHVLEDLQPLAADDSAQTAQTLPVVIDVLANDALGNPLNAVTMETPPSQGSVAIQPDRTIQYFPSASFFGEETFDYRLTDENGDSSVATVSVAVSFLRGTVPIDVDPEGARKRRRTRGNRQRVVHVAILSFGPFFDAPGQIDPYSLRLGPRAASLYDTPRVLDINRDGDDDLVVRFLTAQLGLIPSDETIGLTGLTYAGDPIDGSDSIRFNINQCR